MTSIASAFASGKALIPFIVCGDPDLETTEELAVAMAEAGADLVELGMPFSDPAAEGPVIQAANVRALAGGTTADRVFGLVQRIRARTDAPLVLAAYANVAFSYGIDRFAARAHEAGAQGLVLHDVPFEEKDEFAGPCRAHGIDLVSLAAPASGDRIAKIAREADGFLLCASTPGAEEARPSAAAGVEAMVRLAKQAAPAVPCAVRCDASTPEQARAMAAVADGVVVESAVVSLVAEHGRDAVPRAAAFVHSVKEACRAAQ